MREQDLHLRSSAYEADELLLLHPAMVAITSFRDDGILLHLDGGLNAGFPWAILIAIKLLLVETFVADMPCFAVTNSIRRFGFPSRRQIEYYYLERLLF
jgi:hypothetical protein